MWNSFKISFNLKNTYRVNTIIYSIKQLPILKKVLKGDLYGEKSFKILGNICSILYEIFTTFFGKAIYMLLLIFLLAGLIKENDPNTFINIFTFLTIAGGFINTYMFNPTNDKYYAMILMKMDAGKYTISNFIYMMIKTFVGFLPFTINFGLLSKVNILICLLLPLFVVSIKTIINTYSLYKYQVKEIITDENHPSKFMYTLVGILLLFAYGLPFIGFPINSLIFYIVFSISFILSIICWKYIYNYQKYYEIYHLILTESNMNVASLNTKDIAKEGVLNYIDDTKKFTSNKKGYAYFNDLFIKRHDKILFKFAKRVAFCSLAITCILIALVFFIEEVKIELNKNILVILPTFTFLMYYLNSGQRIAQVLFMNCDSAMLTYGFYREPKFILSLFKERLKSVVLINLLPSIVISICYALLLFISGGTNNNFDYLLIIASINSMSLFFSVHNLIVYYLLQPYNENSDIKSMSFQIVNMATYFVCYFMLDLKLPIVVFGSIMVLFSLVYILVSLYLVYRFANKTFKIHL